MAQIPQLRRLLLEDFKTEKAWIGGLLLTINNFMETVVGAFNKSLSIIDNTTGDIKYVTLNSVPTTDLPTIVPWSKSQNPVAVIVGNCQQTSKASFTLTAEVGIQWQMSGSSLQIVNVFGITPTVSNPYQLTLVCFAG